MNLAEGSRSTGTIAPQEASRLLALLDIAVKERGVPGLQAAVRFGDGSHWTGVSGTADSDRRIQLTRAAVFRVGSLTKLFTAALLLQLVDEGYLSLDDTLMKWLPEFPNAARITVRQLLSHRSGIPEILKSIWVKVRSSFRGQVWRPEQLVSIAEGLRPYGEPGQRFSYSNTNYILVGVIAERVTGRSVAELFRDRFAVPLQLEATRLVPFEPPPAALITGYDRDTMPFPGLYRTAPWDTSWASMAFTSGALVSRADELARFLEALCRGRILSKPALEAMFDFKEATIASTPAQRAYGLGVELLDLGGLEYWGHIGQFIGFMAIAVHAPSRGLTIAIAGNLSVFDVASVVPEIERACHHGTAVERCK